MDGKATNVTQTIVLNNILEHKLAIDKRYEFDTLNVIIIKKLTYNCVLEYCTSSIKR